MEMKKPYAYIIYNGVDENHLNNSTTYLIFANNEDNAYNFCYMYAENYKQLEKDMNEVNPCWKAYKIEKVDITQISYANIRVI
jgi:hypothetical protein